ncbi:type I restriction enzyme S subunit [Halanaerobium congolense]|uniref:Type I restriction enzyme S subunit n=1 Tax=Halanaerobium congolense TaxID=54121 RepID=A0A4R8G4V7_9FIRM|nr:restriction endonuclease subunit S [Halanaerobium congolense]TDX37677.1 type I restriction enzyme S subunit [Halanaerobium congolense]
MVKEGYKKTKYGLIPDSWDFLQLKDIAKVNMGSSPPSSTYNEDGDGLPFFQGNAEFGSLYPEENQWCTDPQKVADKDNILISVRAPVGDINIAPYRCCIGRGLAAIEGEETSNKFIYYCLKQFNPKLQSYSQGSTFSSINKKVLETFFVNYPPLPEQKKIASILSSVDKSIEKTDEVIEETKELKKGLMQELLTKGIGHSEFKDTILGKIPAKWDIKKLRDICNKVTDGTHDTPKEVNDGYPFITAKNITNGKLDFEDCGYVSEKDHKKIISRSKPEKGDILFTHIGTIGQTVEVNVDFEFSIKNVALFKPNNELIKSKYFKYSLQSNIVQGFIKRILQGGVQQYLGLTTLRGFNIPVPPLEEQKKIASILSSVDAKLKKEEEYKAKLERLKKGLMQKLLTGEIRVNTEMEV